MEKQIQDILKMARNDKAGELLTEYRDDAIDYLCRHYNAEDAAVIDQDKKGCQGMPMPANVR